MPYCFISIVKIVLSVVGFMSVQVGTRVPIIAANGLQLELVRFRALSTEY
jgi:hypothetical protein